MNPERILVKVCGTTSVEDARVAVDAGADLVGIVLAPSVRRVTPEVAARIAAALPESVPSVGVFDETSVDEINRLVAATGLRRVQVHGDVSPADFRRLAVPAVRALRVRDGAIPGLADWPEGSEILLDTWDADLGGGTGRAFPWHIAIGLNRRYRLFIAGGLNPVNVASAVGALRPAGVDATSGLESAPGVKDPHLVRRFVTAVRRLERMGVSDPLAGEEMATEDYRR